MSSGEQVVCQLCLDRPCRAEIILIDVDETIIFDRWKPMPEAKSVLRLLASIEPQYKLVLFSHNHRAETIVREADLFFNAQNQSRPYWHSLRAIGAYDTNKEWNLCQVCNEFPGVPKSHMVLFDDVSSIIDYCASQRVQTCQVSEKRGLTIDNVLSMNLVPCHYVFGHALTEEEEQ